MDEPIMLTPHDIWNVFLAVCGAIVAVSAAVAVVIKIIDHFKAPDKMQDKRISDLEENVNEIKKRLDDGNKHFEESDKQLAKLEASIHKSNKLVIESLKVLIEHDIGGDHIEDLRNTSHKIDQFLLEK